jgi:hypothetical protein
VNTRVSNQGLRELYEHCTTSNLDFSHFFYFSETSMSFSFKFAAYFEIWFQHKSSNNPHYLYKNLASKVFRICKFSQIQNLLVAEPISNKPASKPFGVLTLG